MSTISITKATVEHQQATPWNKQGNRTWTAEWFTDQKGGFDGDEGHRVVTLTARHHEGMYDVTASISTAVQHDGYQTRQHAIFKDPFIRFSRERARFSQKRLQEIFDEAYQGFNVLTFYADHEVEH